MAPPNLIVSRPRIVSVRRRDPSRISVGDEAVAEQGPGLLAVLGLATPSGEAIGSGIAPEWSLPFGAAGTAAVYVSNPGGREDRHSWTLATCTVRSRRPCRPDETLLATSRIEALGRTSVTHAYRVTSRESGDCVAEGSMVIVSLGPEGPRPFEARVFPHPYPHPPPDAANAPPAASAPPAGFAPSREAAAAPSGPALTWTGVPSELEVGGRLPIAVSVQNDGAAAEKATEATVTIDLPPGHGLELRWEGRRIEGKGNPASEVRFRLEPGETRVLSAELEALRPHEVNLGRPWPLRVRARVGDASYGLSAEISVPDRNPGLVCYVLTEDCETFDGGDRTGAYGERAVLGNRNDFMDPEDYRVQMVEKPNAMNRIAERYGGRWTHFWTVTQRFAAEWASKRSSTGAWRAVLEALDASVRDGSLEHEYAPHIHFDYDPESSLPPQPRLIYDAATDGIIPNEYYDPATNPDHRYHGWDGARKGIAYVRREGTVDEPDTKAGSLRKSARYLARAAFGRTPSSIVRMGACDFGAAPEDLAVSARALSANGFLADADAGHYERVGLHPRGRQIYFCRADDLEREIGELSEAAVVQLRAPEVQIDSASLEALNAWFDRRWAESSGPGVRAIVALTHAMFLRGAPDPFRDTTGGDFEKLDRHLAYVATRYPGARFMTASEAVLEFLDYYTPEPVAVCLAPSALERDERDEDGSAGLGRIVFPVRILGRGIPISRDRPALVRVRTPAALDPSSIRSLRVLERGEPVAEAALAPGALPEVEFPASGFEGYELEAVCATADLPSLGVEAGRSIANGGGGWEAPSEGRNASLFTMRWPELVRESRKDPASISAGDEWEWWFPGDLFRLLVSPIAGSGEPLGRRTHPYAVHSLGAGIFAALAAAAPSGSNLRPVEAVLECTAPVSGRVGFRVVCRLAAASPEELAFESDVSEAGTRIARVRVILGAPAPVSR